MKVKSEKKIQILITGASGFVGQYLANELKETGTLFLTDVKKSRGIIPLDITRSSEVGKIIKKFKPDEIYHLAAISSPQVKDKALVEKVNVTGTLNILQGVRKFAPQAKVLLVSSGYVYGNCKKPATEKTPPRPNGLYAKSKLKMEREALKKFPDLNIYIARPFTHSGKGQPLGLFFPDMARKIAIARGQRDPEVEVYNPQTKRDFTHVKDVVRAYKIIIKKGVRGEIYNICLGKSYEILDLVKKMAKRSGLLSYKIKKIKHGIVLDLMGDNAKIKKLGWRAKFDVEKIIDDFR